MPHPTSRPSTPSRSVASSPSLARGMLAAASVPMGMGIIPPALAGCFTPSASPNRGVRDPRAQAKASQSRSKCVSRTAADAKVANNAPFSRAASPVRGRELGRGQTPELDELVAKLILSKDRPPRYMASSDSDASSVSFYPSSTSSSGTSTGTVTPTTVYSRSGSLVPEESGSEGTSTKVLPARPAKNPRRVGITGGKLSYADLSSDNEEDGADADTETRAKKEGGEEYVMRQAVFDIVAGPGMKPILSGEEATKETETVVIQYATRVRIPTATAKEVRLTRHQK